MVSDAFIREVDEDLRHKMISELWRKYGKFVIGITIGIVIIVAGRSLYTYFVESKYTEQADAYADAVSLSGPEVSTALDPIIASDVVGYQIIGTFKKVEIALAAEDKLAALATLDQFIENTSANEIYKDMAKIQASIIELDSASVDKIRSRLSLIMAGENQLQYIATEIMALAELKNGDLDAAKTRLETLAANADAPGPVKNRAEQYLSVID